MRALVIDDSKFSRTIISQVLLQFGFAEIVEAVDGYDALWKIESDTYDLITLDLVMPNINGAEVLKHIRAKTLQTKVIVCSSSDYRQIENNKDQNVRYIKKPFTPDALLQLIKY